MISNNRTKYIMEMYKNDSQRPAGCTTASAKKARSLKQMASLMTAWFVKEIICHVYQMWQMPVPLRAFK